MSLKIRAAASVLTMAFFASACSLHGATSANDNQSTALSSQSAQSASTTTDNPESAASDITVDSPINGDQWVEIAEDRDPSPTEAKRIFHDVRIGEHESFSRVVLEFTGAGTAGWMLNWTDKSFEQGRGEPLPLTMPAVLDVIVTGTAIPLDSEEQKIYYSGPRVIMGEGFELVVDGTFEGETHVALGLDTKRMIQIDTLENPSRVVIDIKK